MRKMFLVFFVLCVALTASAYAMPTTAMAPTVVMADSVKWTPMKGMQGTWSAVIYGTPDKPGSGPYAERLKMADGVKFPAHWHLQLEEVTVLSGTLMVGVGDKFDASKLTALGPGSYVAIPAMLHHYAMAKGDTILELHGNAPVSMIMVK